jgi:uncharacterized protein YndB with AHSA1/START domain
VADTYRRHGLIDAPVENVWSIVSNPHTHPDWWPELIEVSGTVSGTYARFALTPAQG